MSSHVDTREIPGVKNTHLLNNACPFHKFQSAGLKLVHLISAVLRLLDLGYRPICFDKCPVPGVSIVHLFSAVLRLLDLG